jgi:hypothetical protein
MTIVSNFLISRVHLSAQTHHGCFLSTKLTIYNERVKMVQKSKTHSSTRLKYSAHEEDEEDTNRQPYYHMLAKKKKKGRKVDLVKQQHAWDLINI